MPDIMMDLLGSMLPTPEYATKEYVQARIAEAMNTAGSGPSVVLEPATFTENGSYQPDPGKAWDDVVVAVPSHATEYAYLDTFNIEEDVHQLTIDISSYDYGEYLLIVNATGTGADYLYFSINSSGTGYFLYIQGNTYRKTLLISTRRPGTYGESGSITNYYISGIATSITSIEPQYQQSASKPSIIRIFSYRSAGVINAGSSFTLYGRN